MVNRVFRLSIRSWGKPARQPSSAAMRATRSPGRRPSICPEMLEPKAAISTTWVPSQRCIANIVHGFSSKRTPERFRKLRTIPSTFARVRRSPILVVSDFNSRPNFEKCASASATVRISLFESRYKRGLPLHTPGSAFRMTISPFGPSCSAEYEPGSLSSTVICAPPATSIAPSTGSPK